MPPAPKADLAFAVRLVRTARGKSQCQVATQMGIKRTYISKVERGFTEPNLRTVTRLSKALGIKPQGLVQIAESRKKAA